MRPTEIYLLKSDTCYMGETRIQTQVCLTPESLPVINLYCSDCHAKEGELYSEGNREGGRKFLRMKVTGSKKMHFKKDSSHTECMLRSKAESSLNI